MKKFLLALLCALTAFGCTVGASACAVSVTPNGNGGFDITPTTSSSPTTNSSEKEDDSSSGTGESSGGQECSHAWDGGVIVTPATCDSAGQKKWTCILCGEKTTQEINALGHSYSEWTESKKATCESNGEEKRVCIYDATHVETRETPALGHSYGEWTESQEATCEGTAQEKRVCANDSTHVEWRDGASAHGHEFGEWTESKKATCESKGEEKRVCIYDATHVETRETPALGHSYGEWVEVSAPTCAKEGEEERVCANDATHKETRTLPKTDEHSVNLETGKCTVCKNTVKERLQTVATADIRTTDKGITWASVDCAEFYQVKISYGVEVKTVDVYSTALDLTPYFAGNKYLYLQFRAMATLDGEYAHSVWTSTYDYEITGESVTTANGIGNTIDLRTGEYTDYDANFESIFDETLFNRLRIVKKTLNNLESTVSYGQDIRSYLESESRNINLKINQSASVNVGKIVNANTSFDFKLGANYERKSQSKTETVLFDMTSYYLAEELSILGSANIQNLKSALSEQFKVDLAKVDSGFMNEADFVNLYGSHVIVSAIYGAKFNVSYNMLYTGESSEINSDLTTAAGIKASVEAALSSSVSGGASSSTELSSKYAWMQTNDSKNKQTSFTVSAIGGKNANFSSLESFANGYQDWIDSVNNNQDNGNLPLIDVSDGGLYCIWDLLASEYPTAKARLDSYLYDTCKANGKAIENKIKTTYYTDFIDFDKETGVLTVNFEGLQRMDSSVDVSTLISYGYYDNDTGVFTVTPQYPVRINGEEVGVDVQKVVFKGKYKESNTAGELFEHGFQGISIRFSSAWTRDIVVEFDSFAYEAKSGQVALDFSEVQSENITINVVGSSSIKGGDGVSAGSNGALGLNASEKTLSITGAGTFEIYGGNGVNATTAGGNGGNGGTAILANEITIGVTLTATGGSGGAGGNGGINHAIAGGRGGDGGIAVECKTIETDKAINISFIGGTGNTGGTGGGDEWWSDDGYADLPDGARGGDGGNGGAPLAPDAIIRISRQTTLILKYGDGGDGGDGGHGTNASWNEKGVKPDTGGDGGTGGMGGFGHNGGTGGNGGKGGYSFANQSSFLLKWQYGQSGSGGYAGNGGNSISAVRYEEGVQTLENGSVGSGGTGGAAGERGTKDNEHYSYAGIDRTAIVGENGMPSENNYNIIFVD